MTFGEFRFRCAKLYAGLDPDILDGYINDRYQKILDRRPWTALVTDATFLTVAQYTAGTVTLTNGSNAVTGLGTVFTVPMTGRKFRASVDTAGYTFTQTGALTGTLDRVYEGTTAPGLGYSIYQDTYDLAADFKLPILPRNERRPSEIVHWTRTELDRAVPARPVFGEPEIYAIAPDKADGTRRAQLYPVPADAASYPYSYIKRLPRFTDDDSGVALASWISIECLMDFLKADVKGDMKAEAKAENELALMIVRDIKLSGTGKLRMAPKYTRHRIERALRGGTGYGRQL